ncbi:MAG: DEAD/DEAH box helicase [Candidatus Woesearchaeota archaeon]
MEFQNFTLDPFQEESVKAIEKNYSVVVSAPTGSGKTLIADFIINKHKDDEKRIIYTAPIKALSNQKYRDFSQEYGEDKIGLMTGDIVINPTAKVVIMTTEIYRNMAVANDPDLNNVAYVIFDEIHYINDIERGYVWEESIIYSSEKVRFLCLSATIPNAQEFSDWISIIKNHQVQTVVATKRNVPLRHLFYDYELGITTLENIKDIKDTSRRSFRKNKGRRNERSPEPNHIELIRELGKDKMPCLFFSFSRKDCEIKARELARNGYFKRNPKISLLFNKSLENSPAEINKLLSVKVLKETVSQGIAFHHAGLLPVVKEAIERLFARGLINVLYTTETFAVGINMPAKTVCFNSLRKYDGINFRNLNTKEYFQIAGRAGRRGIDPIGYVISLIYRPTFRYEEVKGITDADVEPIKSQFRLSVNTVLNLINLHTEKEIEHILRLSFFSYQKFGKDFLKVPTKVLLARYQSIIRKLNNLDFIKNKVLTEKGKFASKIFADEITIGEVFATPVAEDLDEYQMLLVIATLVHEEKERKKHFKQLFKNEQLKDLKNKLYKNEYLHREHKFLNLDQMTAFVYPVYYGKNFFEILELTDTLEGDLMRFFGQILDRIGQIRKATNDHKLISKMQNCQGIVEKSMEGIYLV